MGSNREAQPGAIRFPSGAKNKEEFEALKARVDELEKKLDSLICGKKKVA